MNKYVHLNLIGLIWGSQFFLIKLLLNSINPYQVAFWRSIIGALVLIVISLFLSKKKADYKSQDKINLILLAITNVSFPFTLLAIGQNGTETAIASIIMALIPLFTLVMAIFFLNEPKKRYTISSLIIGLIGIFVLIGYDNIINANHSLLPEILVFFAAVSFAAAVILGKKLAHISATLLSRDVMIIGSLILMILLLGLDTSFTISLESTEFFQLLLLGIFPSGIVYILFFGLIQKTSATFASLTNYLVPIYGLFFAIIILNEVFTIPLLIAMILIFLSIFISEK